MKRIGYAFTRRWGGAAILILALAAGCEEPFEALGESDRIFSIYGFLDAAADTQWVRVMPLRTSIHSPPGPIDATVTLEHLGTGRTVVLSDSIFGYPATNLDGEGVHLHNFSTTEPIEPGATYRLRATRADGKSASVTVAIPRDDAGDVVVGIFQGFGAGRNSVLTSAEHVAMVHVIWDFWGDCPRPSLDRVQILPPRTSERGLEVSLQPGPGDPWSQCLAYDRWIRLVTSGSAWPVTPLEHVYHMNAASNVEGGVGFLGGVRIRVIPYGHCALEGVVRTVNGPWCEIRYGAASATVTGSAVDEQGRPLPKHSQMVVRVADANRTRPAFVSPTGSYRIGGLDPGETYFLEVRPTRREGNAPVAACEPMPLTLAAGEERTIGVRVTVSSGGACTAHFEA